MSLILGLAYIGLVIFGAVAFVYIAGVAGCFFVALYQSVRDLSRRVVALFR